jgi:uncharacterized protein (TIGR03790 family)
VNASTLHAWSLSACVLLAGVAGALGQSTPAATPIPEPGLKLGGATAANPDAAATVIVFNSADEESALLAKFYAEKRGIPLEQMVGLKCSTAEEITRVEYEETIAEPLRRAFTANSWWKLRESDHPQGPVEQNRIRYVALMRGVPLRIAAAAKWEGDKPQTSNGPIGNRNEAAVDSELTVLAWRTRIISGANPNPYFKALTPFRDARRPDLLLVCRLDGPSSAVVRRMIIDGLEVEKTGLRGFAYLDARSVTEPGLKEGDQWLYAAADDLRKNGVPVILDNGPAMFPENYPMRYAALYFGWYSEKLGGPFARPGFRFPPGAIAVHIHSFSGVTVRDATNHWVAPLLNLGAAATLGNVYEPYLSLTPHLDIFSERLRLGFNFAEAAYASQRVLSWMTTCVGDPLYRPFPAVPELPVGKAGAEWEAYRKGALQWFANRAAGEKALAESARQLKSGIIWEGLGLLQMGANDRPAAIASFGQARKVYPQTDDVLRVVIHETIQLRAAGRETDAVQLVRKTAATYPTAPALSVLRLIVPAAFEG